MNGKALLGRVAILAVGIILGLIVASPFFPYAGVLHGDWSDHHGSTAWAPNGRDYSLLSNGDSKLSDCDNSFNDRKSKAYAYDNGRVVATVSDGASNARCTSKNIGVNASGHRTDGGTYSGHGS